MVTPEKAEPLVDFDWGVSPFSGWIQATFGGVFTPFHGTGSWVNMTRVAKKPR